MFNKPVKIEFSIIKDHGLHCMMDQWFEMLEIELATGERYTGVMDKEIFDALINPNEIISAFGQTGVISWQAPATLGTDKKLCFILDVCPHDFAWPGRPQDDKLMQQAWARKLENGGFEFDN